MVSMGGNMHSVGKISVAAIYVPTNQIIKSLEKRYWLIHKLLDALLASATSASAVSAAHEQGLG
jgi:hypothetical protein